MRYTEGLKCRECRREYSIGPIHVCEFCFGPLEVGSSLRRKVTLTFPPKLIKEPVIYNISHRFKVITNIRSANVSENVGWVTLEIDGEEEEYSKALNYLKGIGVKVEPVEKNVIE
jgi:ABC-type methionine transport system ATPase subunit